MPEHADNFMSDSDDPKDNSNDSCEVLNADGENTDRDPVTRFWRLMAGSTIRW